MSFPQLRGVYLPLGEINGAEVKRIFRQCKGIRKRLSKNHRRYQRFSKRMRLSATRKTSDTP